MLVRFDALTASCLTQVVGADKLDELTELWKAWDEASKTNP